jgi:hypothetical protein
MTSVSMRDARDCIVACYNQNQPVMLTGYPGMGKTATFEDISRELKIGFIDFRLPLKEPTDVGGMRVPDMKSGMMRWFCPDDLPRADRDGENGILLFDEINTVAQMMQTTSYGIIQERRIGTWQMPKGWVPMAAGNNVTDRAAAQRMSTALKGRFLHLNVKPELEYTIDRFGREYWPADGVDFLRFRPELFHVMPTADQDAYPSARSWTAAFKFLDMPPALRLKLTSGAVGDAAAAELDGYLRIKQHATPLGEVLANPKTARVPAADQPALAYAMAGMLSRAMTRKTAEPIIHYATRMGREYQILIATEAVKRDASIANTGAFGNWAVRNQEVTL